jgi:hypothetical protein
MLDRTDGLQTVLRFVRAWGWPGKVVVIAASGRDRGGLGLSEEVSAAVDRAVELVESTCTSSRGAVIDASATRR